LHFRQRAGRDVEDGGDGIRILLDQVGDLLRLGDLRDGGDGDDRAVLAMSGAVMMTSALIVGVLAPRAFSASATLLVSKAPLFQASAQASPA